MQTSLYNLRSGPTQRSQDLANLLDTAIESTRDTAGPSTPRLTTPAASLESSRRVVSMDNAANNGHVDPGLVHVDPGLPGPGPFFGDGTQLPPIADAVVVVVAAAAAAAVSYR